MIPAAIMRGHSGSNVWRLAVHEFVSQSPIGNSTTCKSSARFGHGGESDGKVDSVSRRSCEGTECYVIMATGGNDGASKLWDLGFEATCERKR